jgi:hypothetical protein
MIATNTPTFLDYINSLTGGTIVILECPRCHNSFTRMKNIIQSKLGPHNNEKTIYCSYNCAMLAQITKQKVNCLQCKVVFEKLLNQIKKSPNHFCSKSCAAKYNNTHKIKGNRRSKLEIWLENQLTILFPQLKIVYNQKEIINAELDIYIPSLALAFELNGIFHYEPIYGQDKLASIKTNDDRRFQACLEKKIELVIIDTSGQKYFKEKTSQKYLDIIKQIIDTKLERPVGAAPTTSTLAKSHSTAELRPLKQANFYGAE